MIHSLMTRPIYLVGESKIFQYDCMMDCIQDPQRIMTRLLRWVGCAHSNPRRPINHHQPPNRFGGISGSPLSQALHFPHIFLQPYTNTFTSSFTL